MPEISWLVAVPALAGSPRNGKVDRVGRWRL
jgi:hypothetical protein